MLTPDIRGEQARAHREPPYIPAREEKVGADVLLPARRPVPDPGQHEEVGGDDGDVESVQVAHGDRKSTRLNSSHGYISYAVFCLKKKKNSTKLSSSFVRTYTPQTPPHTPTQNSTSMTVAMRYTRTRILYLE